MSPHLVPPINPSAGVYPMDVSMLRPPLMAVTDEPSPRCAMMPSNCAASSPRKLDAARVTWPTEIPWNP